tara:strand:- start:16910 stop:17539 length:630 start_codon:yes stop_codon:yes gene_type:complete
MSSINRLLVLVSLGALSTIGCATESVDQNFDTSDDRADSTELGVELTEYETVCGRDFAFGDRYVEEQDRYVGLGYLGSIGSDDSAFESPRAALALILRRNHNGISDELKLVMQLDDGTSFVVFDNAAAFSLLDAKELSNTMTLELADQLQANMEYPVAFRMSRTLIKGIWNQFLVEADVEEWADILGDDIDFILNKELSDGLPIEGCDY